MNMEELFTKRALAVTPSEIGEYAAEAKKNNCLFISRGMPSEDVFPVEKIAEAATVALQKNGRELLQYGDMYGLVSLRQQIAEIMNRKFLASTNADEILVTTGSTMAIELCSKLFLEDGDVVLVESPSYLDAMNTYRFHGAQIKEVACDSEGMMIDSLKEALDKNKNVKIVYLIPDYQNPTGRRWSVERRKAFLDLVSHYPVVVIEDNPYGEINYTGELYPSLYALCNTNQVIYAGSFSKTFSPGMRLGWLAANPAVLERLKALKEQVDLHSSLPDQATLATFMELYSYDGHIQDMCELYSKRLQVMVKELQTHLPEFTFEAPTGGFFLWLKLPEGVSCFDYFNICLLEQVSFLPGTFFYAGKDNTSYIRLNFTGPTEEEIVEAVQRMKKGYERLLKA